MKSDIKIQEDVQAELRWQPFLQDSAIGVAVKDGIVTLSGKVDAYSKKLAAENAAKKISGVKAIVEDIEVGIPSGTEKADKELAAAILNALKWHAAVLQDEIKISVENGIVKLEGEVDWAYQRNSAQSAIENLEGVRSIDNLITVKPVVSGTDIQNKIRAAFLRSATVDAKNITAEVIDGRVTLKGFVRSLSEKEDAETAAWTAPGITRVNSQLEIRLPEYDYED
jgi:osmotically-inducible protein OsmY